MYLCEVDHEQESLQCNKINGHLRVYQAGVSYILFLPKTGIRAGEVYH
jgi:hypothetical protein